jgi:hypothetical protein
VLEYKAYTRVNPHGAPLMKQFTSNPSLDAYLGRHPPQSYVPASYLVSRNTGNAPLDAFTESRTQFAFGINKADQDCCVSRIDFVNGILAD